MIWSHRDVIFLLAAMTIQRDPLRTLLLILEQR